MIPGGISTHFVLRFGWWKRSCRDIRLWGSACYVTERSAGRETRPLRCIACFFQNCCIKPCRGGVSPPAANVMVLLSPGVRVLRNKEGADTPGEVSLQGLSQQGLSPRCVPTDMIRQRSDCYLILKRRIPSSVFMMIKSFAINRMPTG